jgi:hypothetical protein
MNRVNLYDYGFRHYESALARFTTIDPLAEKYPWISPYAYYRFPYSFDEIIVQSGDFNFTSQGNYWYVAPGSVNTGNGWYSIGMYPDRTIFHRGFSNYYPYAK